MTSRGNPIDKMVLEWNADEARWEGLRRLPLCSIISPQFVRFREDKQAQKDDVRLAQLTDIVEIPDVNRVAEEIVLPESKIIKRAVALKELRGATMVRKIVLWKTNKDDASKDFPAFVILWIGGAVYLSSSSIFFKANALNAALNANNPLAASIPLNDIKLLNFKKAIGTSIISVLSETDSLVFRCFGAKNFLLRISEMVPKVKVVS